MWRLEGAGDVTSLRGRSNPLVSPIWSLPCGPNLDVHKVSRSSGQLPCPFHGCCGPLGTSPSHTLWGGCAEAP